MEEKDPRVDVLVTQVASLAQLVDSLQRSLLTTNQFILSRSLLKEEAVPKKRMKKVKKEEEKTKRPVEALLATLESLTLLPTGASNLKEACELADALDDLEKLSTEEFCKRLRVLDTVAVCRFTARSTETTCNKRKVKYLSFGDAKRFTTNQKTHGRKGSFSVIFHGALSRVMFNGCEFTSMTAVRSGIPYYAFLSGDATVDDVIRRKGYQATPEMAMDVAVKLYFEMYPEFLAHRGDASLTKDRGGYQTIEIKLGEEKSVHITRPVAMEFFPLNQRVPVVEAFRGHNKEQVLEGVDEEIRKQLESCFTV